MTERITLVLSGGSALGAYQAGAYAALQEHGLEPERIVASSIGACNAVIIAGNPPERRVEALRRFWGGAARNGIIATWTAAFLGDGRARALQSPLLGSPGVYTPRFPGAWSLLPGMPGDRSLYDLAPLRANLERCSSFARVNDGALRLTMMAVDVVTGEPVRFDTAEQTLTPDHVLASSGFLPFFPPVEIDGRLLGDGGLTANLPLEAALEPPAVDDRLCIAIDLIRRHSPPPRTVGEAVDRQLELLLGDQTRRSLAAVEAAHAARHRLRTLARRLPADLCGDAGIAEALAGADGDEGATTLLLLTHSAVPQDSEMRPFDYSRPVLEERWAAGRVEMSRALRDLGAERAESGGFLVRVAGGDSGGPGLPRRVRAERRAAG